MSIKTLSNAPHICACTCALPPVPAARPVCAVAPPLVSVSAATPPPAS